MKQVEHQHFFIDENNIAFSRRYTSYSFLRYNIKDKEWSAYGEEIILEPSDTNKRMINIEFINDTLLIGVGSQYLDESGSIFGKDLIWKSTDRGESWNIIYEYYKESTVGTHLVSFNNDKHGIAIGTWGKMMETFDGGDTWYYNEVPERFTGLYTGIEFAGEYPLYFAKTAGINRREIISGLDKNILESDNIKIRQTSKNILISIEDNQFRKYNIQIFDINGNVLQEANHRSGIGKLFRPISLDNFTNGIYFYIISTDGQTVKTGKFSVID
jgi:Secretion system C-terminal sorting domain